MKHYRLSTVCILAVICCAALHNGAGAADTAGDKRRAQLLHVSRIAVVSPFFGTDTLNEIPQLKQESHASLKPPASAEAAEKRAAELARYVETLRKLETHVQDQLPARVMVRTGLQVINPATVRAALSELKLTAPALYRAGGRINGKKFDSPDPELIKRLAEQLHADAVLVGVMDEPRRDSGKYYFDPLAGAGYDSPKVHDKATFDLLLADGTEVLRQTIEVEHPSTRLGQRSFLLADWIETEDLVVEDLMDELTRYTPKRGS